MTKRKNVKVIRESKSGRNKHFKSSTANMNRKEFVSRIERGYYPEYHVRKVNGIKTPVSNPDKSKRNNLG
ncbi:hypothetical protein [Jeotgalicoccus sp. S0W5]|uniref:hypothetical protein n=1 Tax=Jeotgalicoccus sp. S0W5 TaxID=2527874 RepID=UPI00141501BC|nr:hypothetical protein [Jeotgalicoccus sp. S0W5]